MTPIEPPATTQYQRGNKGLRMSLSSAVTWSNIAFFALSALAIVASVCVFSFSNANQRAKDRELEAYKAESALKVAEAHHRAEQARADAEQARAEAADARQKTAELEYAFTDTRKKLNDADTATFIPQQKLNKLIKLLKNVNYSGISVVVGAVTDKQSEVWATQIQKAFVAAGVPRPEGDILQHSDFDPNATGDIQVWYYIPKHREVAGQIAKAFRNSGFEASEQQVRSELAPITAELIKDFVWVSVLKPRAPHF